jgi:uncharacterized membrane protein YphA (DoxX/SURF4 family)
MARYTLCSFSSKKGKDMSFANRFRQNQAATSNPDQSSNALKSQSFQAYEILHAGYIIAPLVAGVDKFFNGLVNWDQYLAPEIPARVGLSPRDFMRIVGAIEITAGIGVALKPKVFAYVVSGWLLGIVGNLGLKNRNYDIALRDVGLALGALALGRLSHQYEGTARNSLGRDILGRREARLSVVTAEPEVEARKAA